MYIETDVLSQADASGPIAKGAHQEEKKTKKESNQLTFYNGDITLSGERRNSFVTVYKNERESQEATKYRGGPSVGGLYCVKINY